MAPRLLQRPTVLCRWMHQMTASTRLVPVQARTTQLTLCDLSPNPGSHIKKQRIGRGGKRGSSSGRGNGGQKHHGKKPTPWFTGLAADPLTDTIPKWNWAPRALKPNYKVLNLDRVQHWIDMGRLDATRPITMRELYGSGILLGRLVDGVKLLGNGSGYFRARNVRIEVSKVSQSAAEAVEQLGGTVRAVYHTRAGIQQLINNGNGNAVLYERPILEKDIDYYADPVNRGYLASREVYEREFKPRGYIADRESEAELCGHLLPTATGDTADMVAVHSGN